MTYLALARKWRPKTFSEVVGQTHVVKALTNALQSGRVHHAFLFTGTRGVGKTTLARIFAKSLNCEQGVSAEPCQQCSTCQSIDEGRYIDLIEVDAASRTRVDDTRELLDNVQYAPSVGKYKVYLIDEVHMLSGHSFNALLKTLEEPPEHVKFLFATTDPQKLPVTVLSRCLQFSLRAMRPEQIQNQLHKILESEAITHDAAALQAIARAADGSMRDGLSLLDQAIAQGGGTVVSAEVHNMLGTINLAHTEGLISALVGHDADKIMQLIAEMAEQAIDFSAALDELLMQLYYLSLAQVSPQSLDAKLAENDGNTAFVQQLAQAIAPEQVQLYYQTGLISKRDLGLAPSLRVGFEMALLRMLAFIPSSATTEQITNHNQKNDSQNSHNQNTAASGSSVSIANSVRTSQTNSSSAAPATSNSVSSEPTKVVAGIDVASGEQHAAPQTNQQPSHAQQNIEPTAQSVMQTSVQPSIQPTAPEQASGNSTQGNSLVDALAPHNEWGALVEQSALAGMTKELALNCACEKLTDEQIELALSPQLKHLYKKERVDEITEAIKPIMPLLSAIVMDVEESNKETPAECLKRLGFERQQQARQDIEKEPSMQALVSEFGVKIVEGSVQATDKVVK